MLELCLNFNESQPINAYKSAYFISLIIFLEKLWRTPRGFYYEYSAVFVLILESLCTLFGKSSEGNERKTADTKTVNFKKCQNSWNQEYVEDSLKNLFFLFLAFCWLDELFQNL